MYVTNDNFFTATPIWEEAKISLKAINADRENLYMGLSDGRLLRYNFASATFDKVTNFGSGIKNLVFAGQGNLFAAKLPSDWRLDRGCGCLQRSGLHCGSGAADSQ